MTEFKNILITGSSKSIGLELVKLYCSRGYKVYGCSRGVSDFTHEQYCHIRADIGNESDVRKVFSTIRKQNCYVDVVINNAGLAQNSLALMTSFEEAQQIIGTNFLGTFMLMREAIRHMKRQKRGRIINFSSINASLCLPGSAIYNASKSAVENLTASFSSELVNEDITINSIGLSIVQNTGMYQDLSEKALIEKAKTLTKKNSISIIEIVHMIDFLASKYAKNITSQTIYYGGIR